MHDTVISIINKVLVSFVILCGGNVLGQDLATARVLHIEGQVEVLRQPGAQPRAEKIAFKAEDQLKAGDTIVTGRNGRLVLGLSDGSQAVIAPKTTVEIKDLSQSPRTLFNLIKGKTRVRIEKLGGQPNPYRVNTPTAVIAVRGTIFDVLVEDDQTEVFLHEGEVEVTNLRAPGRPVFMVAGQRTRVVMQLPPTPPGSFKAGRNDDDFRIRRNQETRQDSRRAAYSQRPGAERGDVSSTERAISNRRGDPGRGGQPRGGRNRQD